MDGQNTLEEVLGTLEPQMNSKTFTRHNDADWPAIRGMEIF